MAIFAIYRFKFSSYKVLTQRFNFADEKKEKVVYNTNEELFESLFPSKGGSISVAAFKEKKNRGIVTSSVLDKHDNIVEQKKNHIVVFRLQANKTRKINKEDWTTDIVGHHPDCRVMVDCRKGSGLMVVEKKTSVFSPDQVCELLTTSFNNTLRNYGVSISFNRLEKSSDFWKGVNEIRDKFKDTVKRVQFDFVGGTSNEHHVAEKDFSARLTEWAGLMAARGSLSWELENDALLKKVENDLTRMSELCYKNSDYNLTVKFKDFGLYRYGQDIQAQLGIDDEIIDGFVLSEKDQDLFEPGDRELGKLERWFDSVNILFEDYDKKLPVQSKRIEGDRI